ncbi:MAG: FmdB family zinc ribbon protein [Desulfonatronovibrionaceae bacterium]
MPIFEYYCTECKELFEEILSSSDSRTPVCPKCLSNEHVTRQVSAVCVGRGSHQTGQAAAPSSCAPGPFS